MLNVDGNVGITIGAGGVIHRDRFVILKLRIFFAAAEKRRTELDLTYGHADISL
ncbi:hypothetical protein D3C86_1854750 [compost metagenome]